MKKKKKNKKKGGGEGKDRPIDYCFNLLAAISAEMRGNRLLNADPLNSNLVIRRSEGRTGCSQWERRSGGKEALIGCHKMLGRGGEALR